MQNSTVYRFTASQIFTNAGGGAPLTRTAVLGVPTAPTPAIGDNSNAIATTSFVANSAVSASNASNITTGTLPVPQLPALTGGDATTTAGSGVITLNAVNSSPGMVGSGTATPVLTIDAKGRVTAVASATLTPSATSLTGTLPVARLPALTGGDASTAAGSGLITLGTVNNNPGAFGSASSVPVVTVNAKGLVTSIGSAALGSAATQPTSAFDAAGSAANAQAAAANATNLSSGTVPVARLPALAGGDATTPAGSGAITLATVNSAPGACVKPTVDAKGRATGCGTLAAGDVVTALNYVPYSSAGGSVTGLIVAPEMQVFQAAQPTIVLTSSGAPSNAKQLELYLDSGGNLDGGFTNDANTAIGGFLQVTRSGYSPAAWTLTGTSANFNLGPISTNSSLSVAGAVTANSVTSTANVISGPNSAGRSIYFETSGSPRWIVYTDTSTESGSNAGSNLIFQSNTDSGSGLAVPMSINRASSVVNFSQTPTVNGTPITAGGGGSGSYTAGSNITITGSTIAVTGSPTFTTVSTGALSASGVATLSGGADIPAGLPSCLNTSTVCERYIASAASNISSCGTLGKIYTYNASGVALKSLDMCGNETLSGQVLQGTP